MTFLAPWIAWAAVASIVIPIAIHLLMRRRRQPVAWAAMELLQRAVRRSAKRSRLEQLLLLAARCFLVAAAGLAVAGPMMVQASGVGGQRPRDLIIVVDQGIASAARVDAGSMSLLSRSIEVAVREVDALKAGDRAAVIVMAGEDSELPVVWPPSHDHRSVRSLLSSMESVDLGSRSRAAVALAGTLLDKAQLDATNQPGIPDVIMLSGWTEGSLEATGDADTADAARALRAIGDMGGQIRCLAAWNPTTPQKGSNTWAKPTTVERQGPQASGEAVALRVEAERRGELNPITLSASIHVLGRNMSQGVALKFAEGEVQAGSPVSVMPPSAGSAEVGIRLTLPPDAQPADNDAFSVQAMESQLTVLLVDRQRFEDGAIESTPPAVWVTRALDPQDTRAVEVRRIDPTTIESGPTPVADAIFVLQPDLVSAGGWDRLATAMRAGSTIVVTPPTNGRLDGWPGLAERSLRAGLLDGTAQAPPESFDPPRQLDDTQPESAMLRLLSTELGDLASPIEVSTIMPMIVPEGADVVLRLAGGKPFLVTAQPDGSRGHVAILGVPMSMAWSNLPAKPLMVPLLQELVRHAVASRAAGRHLSLGTQPLREISWDGTRRIRWAVGRGEGSPPREWMVVEGDGSIPGGIREAGLYEMANGSGEPTGLVAVNVDPRRTSNEPTGSDRIPQALFGTVGASAAVGVIQDAATRTPLQVVAGGDAGTTATISPTDSASWSWMFLVVAIGLWILEGVIARIASHAGILLPVTGGTTR